MTQWTMQTIEKAVTGAGGYFFCEETKGYFKTKTSGKIHQGPGGVYFVSSERNTGPFCEKGERLFTVRQFDPGWPARVRTLGIFQEFKSRSGAHSAARRAAKGEGVVA